MIKYNNATINDWNFEDDNIIKVYRNNAICYYKVTPSSGAPQFDLCYAVVDNIQSYSGTEFTDVYDSSSKKWYKLNNLNQYEEYGVYGSGRNITYYQGKLTVDNNYEYIYSGSSWISVGEVSGSTATLPNVAFSVNYNAKNYDANTKTLAKTSGQLADTDAVVILGTPTVNDGYLGITTSCRVDISGYQTYVNRDNSHPNLTIISKQRTDGNNCHMFANRDSSYNWMYRCYSNKLTLHGSSEQGNIAVTTQPVIESVRVDSNRTATYNNYTDSTSSTYSSFNYGGTNSGSLHLFWGGYGSEYFSGDFYWVYMSQNTLTDEQVQQVITYNEGNTVVVYPLYYDEKQDPLNNLSFSSMTEATEYAYNNCVYDGMKATIAGDRYYFDSEDENGWVEYTPILCDYNFCGVDANGNDVTINNGTSTLTESNLSSKNAVEGVVGNATTTIGAYCFRGIKSTLSALTIGNTVTTIEHEAFMETNKLTTLTIPASVTQIDYWAFTRCTGLTEVIFEGTTPPTFTNSHDGVFHDYCPPVIYVPDSAVSAYRAISGSVWTNKTWSTDIIQPISNR